MFCSVLCQSRDFATILLLLEKAGSVFETFSQDLVPFTQFYFQIRKFKSQKKYPSSIFTKLNSLENKYHKGT